MANWDNCPAVERVAGKAGELWAFKGTEIPLYRLYEHLASGATVDDFAERFPVVDAENVEAVLEHEANVLQQDLLVYPDGAGSITRIPLAAPTGVEVPKWKNCPVVERIPGKVSGAWVFKNSRLALYVLYANLAGGATIDEFVKCYEGVEKWQVKAVLKHAAKELREDLPAYADTL